LVQDIGGFEGMEEESRRPRSTPQQLSEGQVCEMVKLKLVHRHWGRARSARWLNWKFGSANCCRTPWPPRSQCPTGRYPCADARIKNSDRELNLNSEVATRSGLKNRGFEAA